ncbi:uncharacterized protein LOC132758980 [Ruditapes philippinarum]|uniref:uncharacterized protein LOC132758980 n=1 Tax=Ruditapes philippinarum TaxID=129788 RepID=UPI00295B8702|nr:uncharacterized protein LOC132758980 [Ruditapes philippinarum]
MDINQNWLFKAESLLFILLAYFYDISFCSTTSPGSTFTTTTTSTVSQVPTTLATKFEPHDSSKVYLFAGIFLAAVPALVLCMCLVRSLISHRREKRITDNEDANFQHPPPSQPAPRPFLQRDNTIAGPFRNPAFDDVTEDSDERSGVVTPSFVSTRVVDEPGFGIPTPQKKYKYIP